MEENIKRNKSKNNNNLIILLLLLVLVTVAAQTVFMYGMVSNLQENVLVLVNPPEKRICQISKKQIKKPQIISNTIQEQQQAQEPFDGDLNVFNADQIISGSPQLISQGMKENKNAFICTYKIPGVKKKDISLTLNGDYLTIGVQVNKDQKNNKSGGSLNMQSQSWILRTIPIPQGVDKDKITASFENGVLILTIPKIKELSQ